MIAIERVTILVMDGFGVGETRDAAAYGDVGSDTFGNIARRMGGLALPNLARLGLGNAHAVEGVGAVLAPVASYGKMAEASAGKDTVTGHWEMAGLVVTKAFATFPGGFPAELVAAFEKAIGRRVLGNKVASGTVIIDELGDEHVRTGAPILYTSADSVFQIAAHEEVIPVAELYRMCEAARRLCDPYQIARIIARPFVGKPGRQGDAWKRTYNRKDFAMPPHGETVLTLARDAGLPVVGIGKIENIFAGRGIGESIHTEGNIDGIKQTVDVLKRGERGIVFTNLVDFDMLYGHRNDTPGYARALKEFDERLPEIVAALGPRDMLLITGDHGCDPTDVSTDHTREHVPLLCYAPGLKAGINLGTRASMTDMAATIAEALGLKAAAGTSFFKELECAR